MKLPRLFYLILILVFYANCTKSKPIKQEVVSKPVYLFTEQATDTLIKSVLLDETHIEFNNNFFLLKTKSDKEDLNFRFNLKEPRLFSFSSFRPSSFSFYVYITPGDSLSYKLENKRITFKGDNEAHYNFFKALYDLKLDSPRYNEELGIYDYKENRKIDYQKKLHFLEQYVKGNDVSDSFNTKLKNVFKFQYINGLLNRNMVPKGAITDYSEYIKGITIDMFNRNDQDDNVFLFLALTKFLAFVTEEHFGDNIHSKEALEHQLNLINKNLDGNIKQFAITKILSEFDKHLLR